MKISNMIRIFYLFVLLFIIALIFAVNSFSQSIIKDGKKYWLYDSIQQVKILNVIDENKANKQIIKSFEYSDSLHNLKERLLNNKISYKDSIINLQNEQLQELEKRPVQIINKTNWTFWHLAGAVLLTGISIYAGTQIK